MTSSEGSDQQLVVVNLSIAKAVFAVGAITAMAIFSLGFAQNAQPQSLGMALGRWALGLSMAGFAAFLAVHAVATKRLVADALGLRLERRLLPTRQMPWVDRPRITVSEFRGLQQLYIYSPKTRENIMPQLLAASPYEIEARLHELRLNLGHDLPPDLSKGIVPISEAMTRNRTRRQGMIAYFAGALLGFLSFGDTRQVGVQDLPPGVDFMWATPPTRLGLTMAVAAVILGVLGAVRWFLPTGSRANPPIFSTLQEWSLISVGTLTIIGAGLMVGQWLLHPA